MAKTALITGAAGGIGTALAKRMAAKGYNVSLVDIDANALEAVARSLGVSDDTILCTVADVSKEDDAARYVTATVAKFGSIDVFANNAGIEGRSVSIEDMDVQEFDRVYSINVKGVFLGLRAVIPQMRKQGHGSIVNTASLAALFGLPNMAAYIMSKHAVAGLTKVAAVETAAAGIRVNAILPGVINTGMMRRIENDTGDAAGSRAAFEAASPMKRYGEPDEAAAVMAFLLSDDASYVTSSLYTVDGGTMWM
jgi:meso-butanediol dehydrogenase/(S,S)-butanediol dehydrogenase/diacetyl reductase